MTRIYRIGTQQKGIGVCLFIGKTNFTLQPMLFLLFTGLPYWDKYYPNNTYCTCRVSASARTHGYENSGLTDTRTSVQRIQERASNGYKNGRPTNTRTGVQRIQERASNGYKNGRPTDTRTDVQRIQDRASNGYKNGHSNGYGSTMAAYLLRMLMHTCE